MTGTFRHVAKATFLVSKKEGLSDEEFRKYYTEVHAPMALELCKRHGVLDYSIVRLMLISAQENIADHAIAIQFRGREGSHPSRLWQ
jgi:hypothetical protein